MENLTIFTYTHSNARNLHAPYFGRLSQHFPHETGLILCDIPVDHPTFRCHMYENWQPFWQQMVDGLNKVETEFVLYMQEDYILYEAVNTAYIERCVEKMQENWHIGFWRLIWSGMPEEDFRYYGLSPAIVPKMSDYYYSTQATIWRTSMLKEMFSLSAVNCITDELRNSQHLRSICATGYCCANFKRKVGGHIETEDFPYIATAKVKGRWNTEEYRMELEQLWQEYPECRPN